MIPRGARLLYAPTSWRRAILLILAALLTLSSRSLTAQEASVQGIIIDQASAQPLMGSSVVLTQDDQEVRSTLTNRHGLFQMTGIPPGEYQLRITSLGYSIHSETIVVSADDRLTTNRALTLDPLQLEGIDVAAQDPGAARRDLGRQTITVRDIGRVPTPAASGDLVGYLQSTPGVVGTGDRGGQLFVRGGTPSENMVLMDGMLIYHPFHITGFFSLFPEDLVESAEFFPGGFGPRYSGRASSVLDVEMRSGNRSAREVSASISPFLAEVVAEGPLGEAGGAHSYLVSVRRSLIEESSPWLLGSEQPVGFQSYYMKLSTLNPDGGGRCSVNGMYSSDRGGLDPEDDVSRVGWRNMLIGGRCTTLASETYYDGRFGYSRVDSEAITRGASRFESAAARVFMNGDASRMQGRVRVNLGAFAYLKDTQYDFVEFLSMQEGDAGWAEVGTYGEAEVPLGGGLRLLPGAVVIWAPGTFAPTIEPRLRASWRPRWLADAEWSGVVGIYGQRIAGVSDRRDASSVFTAWTASPDDSRVRAIHAQSSWQQSLTSGISWSVDGFYRSMANLPVSTWTMAATFAPTTSLADGRTHGGEARLEYRGVNVYLLGAYGYSETIHESTQENFGVWFGEAVQSYHPPHDRRHQVNALGSWELGRFTLSARWEYGSGFPYTRPHGFDEAFDFRDQLPNVRGRYGETRLLMNRPYNGRLPAIHRLDLSVRRPFDVGAQRLEVQAGVINAYDQVNIFYYDVFTDRRIDQLPLTPYISVRLQPRGEARP